MAVTEGPLDEATRPKAPKIEGVTAAQRRQGRHLAMIHAMHLQDLARVRRVIDEVAAGLRPPQALAEAVEGLPILGNVRRLGALCGRQCHMLLIHHAIEEQSIFPVLDQASGGLGGVIARLRAEHRVIHDLLERLAAAAAAAVEAPGAESLDRLRAAYDALEPVIASHFGYEQDQLEEALGYWGVAV